MSNEEFKESIDLATTEIMRRLYENMTTACLTVEGEAKKLCPADTGVLRASMMHQVAMNDTSVIGVVGNSLEIAVYVHQGTGLYAINGDGRKTPWGYTVKTGKYKGFHWTKGQKPNQFLENAKINCMSKITKILGGYVNSKNSY